MAVTAEDVEKLVANLPPDQLRAFRVWYEKFDADAWDRQMEQDITSGRLDALADAAIVEHRAGKSSKL